VRTLLEKELTVHRRSLLKSLSLGAAAPLLSPLISRLQAEANGGPKPMRFVFLLEGNGLPAAQIQPVGIARNEIPNMRNPGVSKQSGEETLVDLQLSAAGCSLPAPLAPLARHLKRLTILQGLSGRVCGGGHSNDFGALGAYSNSSGAKDITIDAALARANPGIFRHVALGIASNGKPNIIYCCSASGPNQKIPHYQDPALAYNMLFGKILGGNTKAEVGTQTMLLDFMTEDIHRLERQLPGEEAQKLQRFADAFASISKRHARLSEIDAKRIPARRDEVYLSELETKRLEAHVEIAATALITGLTNTVTLASGAGSPNFEVTFKGLGINVDKHNIGHRSVAGAEQMELKTRQFHMELLAKLVDQLQAVPEGNGSMMDNTLIVYLSDSAENHHSTCYEWPMLLLGNLGGRLKTGDRYVNVPKYGTKGHGTVARFYTTLLHAAGAPVDHFGMKDPILEGAIEQAGPLAELLT
jgi:hypothetical protein